MWDVAVDLVLGSECAACRRPGRVLCPACRTGLPRSGRIAWPRPSPPGLALPMAAGEYDGTLKALVNAHKEHQAFALARPLGETLAAVVRDLVDAAAGTDLARVALVPVPSPGRVVRRRGHDPLLRMTRHAAGAVRRTGGQATVARLLRPAARVRDQATLGAEERAANLRGALRARRPATSADAPMVVVDDVITTGATAREAQRALEEAGFRVLGVAAVAATRRRDPRAVRSAPGAGRGSLPLSSAGD